MARQTHNIALSQDPPIETLPPELLTHIFSFLPRHHFLKLRRVARKWRTVCDEHIKKNSAYRHRQRAESLEEKSLWKTLLQAAHNDKPPKEVIDAYLAPVVRHITDTTIANPNPIPLEPIQWLSERYQATEGRLFHQRYSTEPILLLHGIAGRRDLSYDIRCLFDKWKRQVKPGELLQTACHLLDMARSLDTDVVDWLLLPSTEASVLPHVQERDQETASLSELFKQTLAFEKVLLEFTVFYLMEVEVERFQHTDRIAKLFSADFPLPTRLSKTFYLDYLAFLRRSKCYLPQTQWIACNPTLIHYLNISDKFILHGLDRLWRELPTILRSNPALYNRMRPELWIALAKNKCNHAAVILRDSRIYEAFTSEQLCDFLIEHSNHPAPLLEKRPKVMRAILLRLEIQDLCRLRSRFGWVKVAPVATLIHTTLCEKLRDLSTNPNAFAEISDTALETVQTYFHEKDYASEKGSAASRDIISTELNRRTTERPATARSEQERQAALIQQKQAEQARQRAAAQRQQQAQREQQEAALKQQQQEQQKLQRQRALRKQATEEKRKREDLRNVKWVREPAEKLPRQKEKETNRKTKEESTTPQPKTVTVTAPAQQEGLGATQLPAATTQQNTANTPAKKITQPKPQQKTGRWKRFKAKWKTLPWPLKIVAGVLLFLLAAAWMFLFVACPPAGGALVALPLVGTTLLGTKTACKNPKPRAKSFRFKSENIAGNEKRAAVSTKKAPASARKKKTATSFSYVAPAKSTASEPRLSQSAPSRMPTSTQTTPSVASNPNALCNERMRKQSTTRKRASADDAARTARTPATATSFSY